MVSGVRRRRGAVLVALAAATAWTTVGCSNDPWPVPTPSPSTSGVAADDGVSWMDGVPVVPGYGVGEVPPVPTYQFPADLNAMLALGGSDVDLGTLAQSYPGMAVTAADCKQHDADRVSGAGGKITWTQNADGSLGYAQGGVTMVVGSDGKSGLYKDGTRQYANFGNGSGTYKDDTVDAMVVQPDGAPLGSATTFSDGRQSVNSGDGSGYYKSDQDIVPGEVKEGDFAIYNDGQGAGSYEDGYVYVANFGDGTGEAKLKKTGKVYDTTASPLPPLAPVTPLAPLDPATTAAYCGISLQVDPALMFDFGSAELRPGAQGMLDAVAQALKDNKVPKAVIEGHTDAKGDPAANQTLSEQRAQAVVDALKSRGVTTTLVPKGYGSTRPIASETTTTGADDPAGRQLNRRVEIFLPDA